MKQPRNRRGRSLQRNDEGSFHQVVVSIYISLLPVLSAKVFYLTLPQVTFLHAWPAVYEFTQLLSDIHRQFQLGKLLSPFLSGASIAISHPETDGAYVLHFNLAASLAFEIYQLAKDYFKFTKDSQVPFAKRKTHIAFYEVKENSLFLGKRGSSRNCEMSHKLDKDQWSGSSTHSDNKEWQVTTIFSMLEGHLV